MEADRNLSEEAVLIIGAGQAAAQTATSLRQGGFEGQIVIAGDEPFLPYQRPPLSKTYLKGELERENLYFKNSAWYEMQNVEVLTSTSIDSVSTVKQSAMTNDGRTIGFDHLVFATGSRNRRLPMKGAELENVFGLRDLSDVDALRPHVGPRKNLVIIGAGYIGLETAAVANSLGTNVTVLEAADRVLSRVTSPVISSFYEKLHNSHGVTIRTNCATSSINESEGKAVSVTLSNGDVLPCDALLIGIGILPNIEVAAEAGVACEDGILVDERGRTNLPGVYAAGDCAKRLIQPFSRLGRLESVHNAIEQGKQVAASILDKPSPKIDCPWFWSDQYNVKLQIAGLFTGYDDYVIRGDYESEKFAVFYFKNDVMLAADAINSPPEFMSAKRLISAKAKVSPSMIADMEHSLKDIIAEFI
ncbi:3-phenylpropionate/trans-cinnamate dioxygenase ferredoxin reductase subunit [Parasphingorhabdus marina DSM 22363]|uniref:3-phenylpropionate/trans-cinnamate dioxygenase ferredoxin reductase subunit n=1 Tax=Parasphingorhabdus marina DSM 22363 TaxID=1123272 RepID=A0A1N6D9N5_9SPHN|nr:FAD-dependent oxidoreductase [Parasphingorhabdus marina]SIN67510.1 3-phenylpropionate/trans-cinnamate dioxygenase ferredoxin reductase subunit [Parasphingorhabdus marina DSM 22363]